MVRTDLERGRRDRFLDNAARSAREHDLSRFSIVDVDCHHEEALEELLPYLDEPWRRRVGLMRERDLDYRLFPSNLGDPTAGGRIKRPAPEGSAGSSVERAARQIGIGRSVVLPTGMFSLSLHPQTGYEVALAEAYARWMVERVLPEHPSLRCMPYLPFSDPDVCVRLVEDFGRAPGVVGFVTSSVRYEPVYHNRFVRIYAALEERGLPLGFHPAVPWRESPFEVFNKFVSAYAYGVPLYHTVHLTNLVINGVLERFPGLRCIFFESGLSWLPFVLHRLDNEYRMRTSEAPLLKAAPSSYIRRQCYFTTQPLEWVDEPRHLEALFRMVGESRLLYASNYPQADFDLPERICDLPFLADEGRRRILGGNAIRLFRLESHESEE